MKQFLKISGMILLGIVVIIYLCFLFVLPNVVDLNKYKPMIKDIVREQAKLDLDFGEIKMFTTPLLGVGAKLGDVSIKLPDGSLFLSFDKAKAGISLPSLLIMTINVSSLEFDNPFVNVEIAEDNSDYKFIKLIEDILNEKKEAVLGVEKQEPDKKFKFNKAWIKIKVPGAKLNNYKILVTDLKSKHFLDLHGEKLKVGYFNRKTLKVKTVAELFSDNTKNIYADLDIDTYLPAPRPKLDAEDDPAERIDIRFVNSVSMYQNYDLKTNIDAKYRARKDKKGRINAFGHINIEDITMKVSELKLPASYARFKMFGSTVDMDTNIYPADNQNIQLIGKFHSGVHPRMDMNIKTAKIQFNDLLTLSRAFLDSLRIKNELRQYKADGSLVADCYIKTNFKKLKSDGFIKVENGGLAVRNLGQVISKANIRAILENSVLDIKDSSLYVNGSKVTIDGSIDKSSVAAINVKTEKMPLAGLFNAFAPKDLRETYIVNSGNISLDATILGKLKEAISGTKFQVENLNFSQRKNSFNLKNNKLFGEFTMNNKTKTISGNITNDNFKFVIPKTGSSVVVPKLDIEVADKNVYIKENDILFNDNSKAKYSGEIVDYNKLKSIKFNATGNIDTNDIVKFIGFQMKSYMHSQGSIPVKLILDGDKNKQTLVVQALADKNNFITPADFTEIGGKNTSLQAVVDFKPRRIKIKKTGLFERVVSVDEKGNETVNLKSFIDIDGTIAGRRINLIKITIPEILSGKLCIFPKSSLLVDKSKLFVYGQIANPIIRGRVNINELKLPELLTSVDSLSTDFRGRELDFALKNALLNGSDVNLKGNYSLLNKSGTEISNLDISSKNIVLEKIMKVVELAQKYMPAPQNSGVHSVQNKNIPVTVRSGNVNLRRLSTGNIVVQNYSSHFALAKNILYLNRMRADIFGGNIHGNAGIDLLSTLVNIDVQGENINVARALWDSANIKDMLTGTAEFDAKLGINGAAKNAEEQMRGISGDIDFAVNNGQFGPFGKIENLIIAENIRESQFFQTALGGIINKLTSIDTTHFEELKGHLTFEDGICHINPITSYGEILSLHVFGDFDLIKNYADMKVRARMASLISKLLGPLNAINPVNIMNSAASLNVVTAKAFSLFCEVVPSEELETLPSFANKYVDSGAAKFQLGVRGDAAKPLTLVKSFKWLSSRTEYDDAMDYVNSLPEEIEGSTATNIEEAIAEARALEAEKKTLKYKVKHIFKRKGVNKGVNEGVNDEVKSEELIQEEVEDLPEDDM